MSDIVTVSEMKQLIKSRLSEKRYRHSIEVSKEAVRLSEIYGADKNSALIAGLLHDIMKEAEQNEMCEYIASKGVMLNMVEQKAPKLWHAIAGALYIEHELNIKDIDIINAVRYHTTARSDMGILEKVLYLADFTSLDRDYEGVEELRAAVTKDMVSAMKVALCFTINDLCSNEKPIHEDTLGAYNRLICKEN